jgi:hypothetical protein
VRTDGWRDRMPNQIDEDDTLKPFLEAIECERRAWNALQHPPYGLPQDIQALYAAWVQAVSRANMEGERFLQKSRARRRTSRARVNSHASLAASYLRVNP